MKQRSKVIKCAGFRWPEAPVTRYQEAGGSFRGVVRQTLLGEEASDCVDVSPDTVHQFHAGGDEPLGFLCMVDRERDRPRLASAEERTAPWARLSAPPADRPE